MEQVLHARPTLKALTSLTAHRSRVPGCSVGLLWEAVKRTTTANPAKALEVDEGDEEWDLFD